jgi:hypothetical protein
MQALRSGSKRAVGALSQGRGIATQTLPDLPYDYGALSPVIIPEIMELHHKKHHQAYVTNLNIALEKYADAEAKGDVAAMINLQPALKFNGGGTVRSGIATTVCASMPNGWVVTPCFFANCRPIVTCSSNSPPPPLLQATSTIPCSGRCSAQPR